ncbi:MAG: hypothetical protein V5B32_12170 [Candidatus Accumulibacter sp. UW26]|jgi:hypothetical protein
MLLPPLLDPAKLFFFINANEDLYPSDLHELEALFALPGNPELRADNVHFILCLLHDCVSMDFERYINDVFLPWTGLKRRTSIHRERILQEFSRIGQFSAGSPENMAHLVQLYRNIVSDLFDPYLTLIVASYQFKHGSFTNIDNANLARGERNKVEYISARNECGRMLIGYDGRVRNAISHSGSHGVTYRENEIVFRDISRSVSSRVTMVTWTVAELEKRIVDLFECIISIDAVENVFGIDCLDGIVGNAKTLLQFLLFHSDLNERQRLSARLDSAYAAVRENSSLSTEEKIERLAPIIFFHCGARKMPVTSLSVTTHQEVLSILIPISGSLLDDSALIDRAMEMMRYGVLAQTIFQNLFSSYRTIEVVGENNASRLEVVSGAGLLKDYCDEKAGLVDLLNDSAFFEAGRPILIQIDFAALSDAENSSLNEPFPRYKANDTADHTLCRGMHNPSFQGRPR